MKRKHLFETNEQSIRFYANGKSAATHAPIVIRRIINEFVGPITLWFTKLSTLPSVVRVTHTYKSRVKIFFKRIILIFFSIF
jgi:hypothetical protein